MKRPGLWAHPDFVRLWAASTVSLFGSLVSRTALPFAAILVLGATPLNIGWLAVAELVPGFVVGLVAGAWVDRLRRRPIMIVADLGRAALLTTIPIAAVTASLSLAHLYLVAVGTSILSVCFDVAYQSYLPALVGRDALLEGNGKLTAAGAVAEASAFSAGGWLVQIFSAPVAVLIDAATFVWSATLIARIRAIEPVPGEGRVDPFEARGLWSDIADGLCVLRANRILLALAGSNAGLNAAFSVTGAVILIYANRELGFSPGALGVIFAVGGVSSFAGALVTSRLVALGYGAVMTMTAALAFATVGQALLPLATAANAVAILLLVGQQLITDSAATVYDITQVSLRQAMAPPALLGRINATVRVLETGAMASGALPGGWLGEQIGLRPTLLVGSTAMLASAVWLFRSPVRFMRETPQPIEVGPDRIAQEKALDAAVDP